MVYGPDHDLPSFPLFLALFLIFLGKTDDSHCNCSSATLELCQCLINKMWKDSTGGGLVCQKA